MTSAQPYDISAYDHIDLRRWAVERVLGGQPATAWSITEYIEAAAQLEAYVLGGFGPTVGVFDPPGDRGDAAPVEVQDVGLGHGDGRSVAEASDTGENVEHEGVGDGLGAVASDNVGHTDSSVGRDNATVGEGGGAVMASPPNAP